MASRRALPLPLLLTLLAAEAARLQDKVSEELASGSSRAAAFAGRVLAGRYELLEPLKAGGSFPYGGSPLLSRERFAAPKRLGSGAFGEAWKAYDRQRRDEVVVKLFTGYEQQYLTESEGSWAMEAARECGLSRRIVEAESSFSEGRGNICGCVESHAFDGAEDDLFFIVTEFCGQSLKERMEAAVPPTIAEVRAWMLDVMKAIRFMSGLKPPVSHQDLNLGNVVVAPSGRARLIDFGLATEVEASSYAKTWAEDVQDWAYVYGRLLCQKRGMRLGQPSRCRDGSVGVGTDSDWGLVAMAEEARTGPAELMRLLERLTAAP